ncbi:FAA hydrolase family protein [Mesorhizobium sp. M7A.F.Ca.US.006.01.1.1]|uniref:fumarylacetoacetate hydrolase family protein n=1 Tax=Mesorhizobium sp. M7A.F.Ca.US.006.01.1.1 TaxID=2496707 RepID=UPI000FCC55A6|nr:fumarylacetoacetate hydrolase family protein [Mesorhizobium sp. M7A.F.Ca.US.006.01.1.1]RUZ72309.1 FAA hydrolase family protein [Mesorhizobium sp. M7A.F.Ca.US.006.01.1.1]
MKFASYRLGETTSWGLIEGETIVDVGTALKRQFADLKAFLSADALAAAVEDARSRAKSHAISAITWLPVVPNPDKIICVGHNYDTHSSGIGHSDAEKPTIFARFANTQTGHRTALILPRISSYFDYEGELAVIIGTAGRYIQRGEAMAHVAGYACYNEASVRDFQRHTSQYTPGKNFPKTGGFGPWMVTRDEVGALGTLRIQTRLNGEVVQDALLEQMIFDVPALIEYCSSFTRLEAGDVIVTGTPGGIGLRREPPLWLKHGDSVEVEIDKIGLLQNSVTKE